MKNQIICGNCKEVMGEMPDNYIDLTVTSPPYDNLRSYEGYEFDFEGIAKELYRVTKPGGVVVWVVADATINGSETLTSFFQAIYFKEIGFNLHDTMIYCRESMPLTHKRYEQHFEYMFVLVKGKIKTFNGIMTQSAGVGKVKKIGYKSASTQELGKAGGKVDKTFTVKEEKLKGNIWKYPVGGGSCDAIAFQHPAVFPEQLAADHILSWSNEGDLVLDPFSGSGTTCKMAVKLNRDYIGIDISEKYCGIARQRIDEFQSQLKLAI